MKIKSLIEFLLLNKKFKFLCVIGNIEPYYSRSMKESKKVKNRFKHFFKENHDCVLSCFKIYKKIQLLVINIEKFMKKSSYANYRTKFFLN